MVGEQISGATRIPQCNPLAGKAIVAGDGWRAISIVYLMQALRRKSVIQL